MLFLSFCTPGLLLSANVHRVTSIHGLTQWGGEIADEVVASLLTALLIYSVDKLHTAFNRNRFAKIYGMARPTPTIVHGTMEVNPKLLDSLNRDLHISPEEKKVLLDLPLTKSGTTWHFSGDNAVGAADVKATAYLAKSFAEVSKTPVRIENDVHQNIQEGVNFDFIALGLVNNLKTRDMLEDEANDLVDFRPTNDPFSIKGTDTLLYQRSDKYEFGIILKCHPKQFPSRTWIACAGVSRWGTSGSAWFLANRWKDIAKKLNSKKENFVAVIRVKRDQDESASLVLFATTREQIVTQVRDQQTSSRKRKPKSTLK
jgi:hypothetical protein